MSQEVQMNKKAPRWSPSLRMERVQTPIIPTIAALVHDNPGTISLGQGVVYYGPPPEVMSSLQEISTNASFHKYGPITGNPRLIAMIASKLQSENGIQIGESNEIIITAGSNMAFHHAMLAITDPGDEIILISPYYFNHEMAIRMVDAVPIEVPSLPNYHPDLQRLAEAITPRTRAIVTISPNNPTGAVYTQEELTAINELCARHGIWHLHDEAYEYFVYTPSDHFSPGSLSGASDHTISLFSFSKSYGMASWRVGMMVVPKSLVSAIIKSQDTILICAPEISQLAAIGALEAGKEYCSHHINLIDCARTHSMKLLEPLRDHLAIAPAEGAFYLFLTLNSKQLPLAIVQKLVKFYKVAAVPGTAFGVHDRCILRVSYGALKPETVEEGIGRLATGLKGILDEEMG